MANEANNDAAAILDEARRLEDMEILRQAEMRILERRTKKTTDMMNLIEKVPPFKGDPSDLHEFISRIRTYVVLARPEESVHTDLIVRAIRDRVQDKAHEALKLYGTPNTWGAIEDNLTLHFADRRDEDTLLKELYDLRQGNEKFEIFFAKISNTLNALKSWARLNRPNVANQKVEDYDSIALSRFTKGLRQPLGSYVRCMKPNTLAEARRICIEEQTCVEDNYRYYPKPIPIPARNTYPQQLCKPPFRPQVYQNQILPPMRLAPQANRPPIMNNNNRPQNVYYNHRPFAPNKPRSIQGKPEPMDTTTNINKYRQPTYGQKPQGPPQRSNFQPNAPPRYTVEELFNSEQDEDLYGNQEEYEDLGMEPTLEGTDIPIVEIHEDLDFQPGPSETLDT